MIAKSVVPAWTLICSREEFGAVDLPLLTVTSSRGVGLRDLDEGRAPSEDLRGYRVVRRGDLVVNRLWARFGAYGVSEYDGIISPAYWVLVVDQSSVRPRFLHYLLRSELFKSEIGRISKNMPPNGFDLPWEQFRRLQIPLPELTTQQRIADYLDGECARIDRLIALRQRQLDLVTERRDTALSDIFDHRSEPVVQLRRVVTHWIDYRGATPEKTTRGVQLVTAKNIRNGIIDYAASEEFIADDVYKSWMRRGLPRVGDVLLTTEAPLGEVAEVDDEGIALAQRVILLRPSGSLTDRWLYWFLRSRRGQDELFLRATGSTALGIKADRLRGVPIPLPPISEQSSRLQHVEEAEARWHSTIPVLRRSIDLLWERKQALITAAVTGQFDVSTAGRVA